MRLLFEEKNISETKKYVIKTVSDPNSPEANLVENSLSPNTLTGIMLRYAYTGGLKSPKDSRYVTGRSLPNSSRPVVPSVYALYPHAASSQVRDGGLIPKL